MLSYFYFHNYPLLGCGTELILLTTLQVYIPTNLEELVQLNIFLGKETLDKAVQGWFTARGNTRTYTVFPLMAVGLPFVIIITNTQSLVGVDEISLFRVYRV